MKTLPHARKLLAPLGGLALLIMLCGCNPHTIFGRPQNYQDLAVNVVDAFSHDRYDLLQDLVITNGDRRMLGQDAEGLDEQPYGPADDIVRECYSSIRKQGADAGIIWDDARLSSYSAPGAQNKYKEFVDLKITIDSRGNRYDLMIKNAQMVDHGDIVLTDRLQWLGGH